MTPHMLLYHREEYTKRVKSGLEWRESHHGRYYHVPFDAKRFLGKFSEEDARAVSDGIVPPPRAYAQDKRFAKLRRTLEGLSEEARGDLMSMFQLHEEDAR